MKILGGNQYIFYAERKGSHEAQLEDCLAQLEEYMDENQIYSGGFIRHNIFINISTQSQYDSLKDKLRTIAKRRFPMPLIINVIAQKPEQCDVALESTHIQATLWNCLFKESQYGSCQLIKKGEEELVIGSVQVNKYPELQKNAEIAFEEIEQLLDKCSLSFQHIVKQWNYIERLLDDDIYTQRYQAFNDVRTRYYENDFDKIGYPASSEVGMTAGGIIIEFLAVKNRKDVSLTVNNPIQKAPHLYSKKVLAEDGAYGQETPTTPKLERARSLELDGKKMLFISGTSAIIGEKIMASGDCKEQTIVILENIKRLYGKDNLQEAGIEIKTQPAFNLVKAYVSPNEDAEQVYNQIEALVKDTPILLVKTELPRKDILVELELEMGLSV